MLILNKGGFIIAIIIILIFIRSSGWLTPRSREKPRNDAIIIQLAAVSIINRIIINTRAFSDKAPYAVSVDVCFLSQVK
jgi:allantoicase